MMLSKTTILKMFARSPMRPLQKHMEKANAAVQSLLLFFNAVCSRDWTRAESEQKRISYLETEADKIKVELKLHLPKGLFLPVPRGDLIYLLTKQEDIADRAEDIAGLILGRRLEIPEVLKKAFMQYMQSSADAVKQAMKVINELDELLEVGFRGKIVGLVGEMIHKLNEIEAESDQIQMDLRYKLFVIEDKLKPVDVMFIYKVVEWVADLSDYAQKVGSGLQILLAR